MWSGTGACHREERAVQHGRRSGLYCIVGDCFAGARSDKIQSVERAVQHRRRSGLYCIVGDCFAGARSDKVYVTGRAYPRVPGGVFPCRKPV